MGRKHINKLPPKVRREVKKLGSADQDAIETALTAGEAANNGDTETLARIADSLPRNPDGTYKLD